VDSLSITKDLIKIHQQRLTDEKNWIVTASDIMFSILEKNDTFGLNFYAKTVFQAMESIRKHRSSLIYLYSSLEN
jgi:hypothetical protein